MPIVKPAAMITDSQLKNLNNGLNFLGSIAHKSRQRATSTGSLWQYLKKIEVEQYLAFLYLTFP
jgi:hypothetical protein